MREIVRPVLATLSVACLAIALTALSNNAALAQAKQQMAPAPAQGTPPQGQAAQPPQLKQIALTDKQIDGVLAAQKEMNAITQKLPENAAPDPKVLAQLDGVAKKNGFAGNNEYYNVLDNISLVLGGIDPSSKKYVGPEAVIKAQIAEVQADKKMSAKDKKQALDDLNEALKEPPPPVENKGNIDLVVKNYDKLNALLGADEN
ncbi:hypothetical protein [Bradyrhizobium sp. NP1]|jgi:hypothetical protein|uniref:hypothetical protein n=1 Tax=Bradyrhizobium sp. NP1 TaxID=3049772 RepID=UPI0025A5E7A2|nr:hypothetical protein [Bradyrhizobium sp. NP1]WJR79343.1 hypothetical protein QOU61_06060 [Bradyrhizobium sp. NP1]